MHEQEGESEPAHYARRPMNAFLIFCKRHRSVVRDKYPNLENRSITKILGEWWANLEKEEKACYTSLAKQYKDAFFSANPDFKWYKLPAPPLRTLSSRPRESIDKPTESPNTDQHESELEKTNNNSTKVDFNKKPKVEICEMAAKPLSMFTPGKLADEAQMGGLSSLLATKTETRTTNPYYSPPCFKYNAISTSNDHRSHNVKETAKSKGISKEDNNISELQNALSETTKVFEEDFDEEKDEAYRTGSLNDQFTNQDMIDQIVDKRFSKDDDYQRNSSDDEKNAKSGRSCKGKRYQEFMAVGGLIVNKRQKRDSDKSLDESFSARSDESNARDDPNQSIFNEKSADAVAKIYETDAHEQDNNANKTFKAADFDLDAKISALPPLSLEKFQEKKRENKRRKKTINLKPKALEPSHIVNSVPMSILDERRGLAETWRENVIGSQKRKPRKVSITRLEINSMVSSVDFIGTHKISPDIKIAMEAPRTVVHSMEMCNPSQHSVDLMALATLAEVASNTSKLDDTMTAKARDEHVSMV